MQHYSDVLYVIRFIKLQQLRYCSITSPSPPYIMSSVQEVNISVCKG